MGKRILMVMTRDIPLETSNGRERTLSFIRNAIGVDTELSEFKIRSVFEVGGLAKKLGAVFRLGKGMLHGAPCALQVAIFWQPHKGADLLGVIDTLNPDVVYFDGIRLVDYATLVRLKAPGCRIIMDFDDLMSRRANILREAQVPLAAGYLANSIPKRFLKIVNSRLFRDVFLCYEEIALQRQEREAVEASNAVTLVSTADAFSLKRSLTAADTGKVHTIAPPMNRVKSVSRPSDPLRFVFIGSDSQLQNRLAIEYLVDLWKRLGPLTPLIIFGRMVRRYDPIPNVIFAGFAQSQADVYTSSSIALCPAFLRGGIKTKVVEAISYGCVPVGNEVAYEGFGFHNHALAMSQSRFERFVLDPTADLTLVTEAATQFEKHCELNYSVRVFGQRWRDLFAPVAVS